MGGGEAGVAFAALVGAENPKPDVANEEGAAGLGGGVGAENPNPDEVAKEDGAFWRCCWLG